MSMRALLVAVFALCSTHSIALAERIESETTARLIIHDVPKTVHNACCLTEIKGGKPIYKISDQGINDGELEKCLLVAYASSEDCPEEAACQKVCTERLQQSSKYWDLFVKDYTHVVDGQQFVVKQEAEALTIASEEQQVAQAKVDDLKKQLLQAESTLATKEEALATATKSAKAEEAKMPEFNAHMESLTRSKDNAQAKEAPVPEACTAGEVWGMPASHCCCSIDKKPYAVDRAKFTMWETCKNPAKLPWNSGCTVMGGSECKPCRDLVCNGPYCP